MKSKQWILFWILLQLIGIGIPLWWTTTSVTRAPLPLARVRSLTQHINLNATALVNNYNNNTTIVPIPIHIRFFFEAGYSIDNGNALFFLKDLGKKEKSPPQLLPVQYEYQLVIWDGNSRRIFDSSAADTPPAFQINVLDVSDDHAKRKSNSKNDETLPYTITLGADGTIILRLYDPLLQLKNTSNTSRSNNEKFEKIWEILEVFLNSILEDEYLFMDLHLKELFDSNSLSKEEQRKMLQFIPFLNRVHLSFTLLNANSQNSFVNWNVEKSLEEIVYPFLHQFHGMINFTMDSQIQNHIHSLHVTQKEYCLPTDTDKAQGAGCNSFYELDTFTLSSFVNQVEWNLASYIPKFPTMQFLVYIPNKSVSPLYIAGEKDRQNIFMVPGWGGVAISNIDWEDTQKMVSLSEDALNPILANFVSQLRTLLNLQSISNIDFSSQQDNIIVEFKSNLRISSLELSRFRRINSILHLMTACRILDSLLAMLDGLENIRVEKQLERYVTRSIEAAELTLHHLKAGDFSRSFDAAVESHQFAQVAYFNPSIVSLLYFPEDHKYAIYVPLFLPISVPLMVALLQNILPAKKRNSVESENSAKSKLE